MGKDLNDRHFTRRDIQMTSKHLERCLTSLVIRKMQIKTIRGYHYIHTQRIKISKTDNNKYWQRCGATRTLIHRNLKMRPSSQLYVDIPGVAGRKETCVDGLAGLVGLAQEEGEGRGLAVDRAWGMPASQGQARKWFQPWWFWSAPLQ